MRHPSQQQLARFTLDAISGNVTAMQKVGMSERADYARLSLNGMAIDEPAQSISMAAHN
jgi:hypothetical protein